MKKLLTICLLALAGAAHAQAVIQFETDSHDFGNVPEGTMATHEFKFKNTGNQPVVSLLTCRPAAAAPPRTGPKPRSCPARSGIIKAMYSSAGRPGVFNKTVTVTSNAFGAQQGPQHQRNGTHQRPRLSPRSRRPSWPPRPTWSSTKARVRFRQDGSRPAAHRPLHGEEYRQNRASAGRAHVGLLLRGLQE